MYKRVFLKLSGEALANKETGELFDDVVIADIVSSVIGCIREGVGFGIMIGAGNIWRGKYGKGINRAKADHMGMLATTINCLRVQDTFQKLGCDAVVMSAQPLGCFTEPFNHEKAVAYINAGRPVIFACGAGIPYISTDTAGVVRALEIDAEVILMAKNVNGVYTEDPKGGTNPSAKRYKKVSYKTCLDKDLKATDSSASAIAMEQGIDTYVFSLRDENSIKRAVMGENIGTLVCAEDVPSELY